MVPTKPEFGQRHPVDCRLPKRQVSSRRLPAPLVALPSGTRGFKVCKVQAFAINWGDIFNTLSRGAIKRRA